MPKSKPPLQPESMPSPASKAPAKNAATARITEPAAAITTAAPTLTPTIDTGAAAVVTAASVLDPAFLADPAQQSIARQKYQALHDQISSTREGLPGSDTTNRTLLRDRAEEAQEVLTTLDRNDLQSNTQAFTLAATQIQQANADMTKLSDSIGGIIHDIQAAADFVHIADEAVSAASKFIA